MTIREFVNEMFDAARVDGNELMTLDTAKTDLANYRAEGWELPDGITPESYMEAWNELVNEQAPTLVTRYEVYTESIEIDVSYLNGRHSIRFNRSWSTQDILDEYNRKTSHDPRLIGSYATLKEATEAYEYEVKCAHTSLTSGHNGKLLMADIVILGQATYVIDEDGEEWLDQGEELDSYAEPFIVPEEDDEEED